MKKITISLLSVISLCLILITLKLYIPQNFLNFKNFNNFISTARQRILYVSLGEDWACVEGDELEHALCDSRNAGSSGGYPFYYGFGYSTYSKEIVLNWMEPYISLNFCKKRMRFLAEKDSRNYWSKPYGCVIQEDENTRKEVYRRT